MTTAGPIGFFDSGVGGLAVAAVVRRLLPHEPILYFADTANFPYGPKSADAVFQLARSATRLLLDRGAKLIVVACNTATSAALEDLRLSFPAVPFVGVVPAVKPASAATRSHRVGILATEGTLKSHVLQDLVAQFAGNVDVRRVAAPELADLVEFGDPASAEGEALVRRFVDPLLADKVDVLVLGCTHFAFLRPQVERIAGKGVAVIDTSGAVARQVERLLGERVLTTEERTPPSFLCLTSGRRDHLERTLANLRRAAPGLLPVIDAVETVETAKEASA